MSTIKADALTTKSDNTDLTITGHGSGVPNIEAGFKVGGSAGVPTASIQDDAITSAKIADDAVGTAAIADDAITSALIADDAVVTAAIAAALMEDHHRSRHRTPRLNPKNARDQMSAWRSSR